MGGQLLTLRVDEKFFPSLKCNKVPTLPSLTPYDILPGFKPIKEARIPHLPGRLRRVEDKSPLCISDKTDPPMFIRPEGLRLREEAIFPGEVNPIKVDLPQHENSPILPDL